ncbi:MAG TPA: M48 family metalloprotease [Candidatus Eisenbacteria bacterium]|nr:M48 family metalloprotease [Candidatus Eisenbacteria bacterium]
MRLLSRTVLLSFIALGVGSFQARSQERPDRELIAWATLEVTPSQPAKLRLMAKSADPAITAALEQISGRPPEITDYATDWVQWSTELPAPAREQLILRQSIPLKPLMVLLQSRGEPSLSLMIQHPEAAFVHLRGARSFSLQRGTLSASVPTTRRVALLLQVGWRPGDVAKAAGWLIVALLLPILAGLVVLQRSRDRDQSPNEWFKRSQALQIITMAGWVLWMIAVEATHIAGLVEFAFPGESWARMTGLVWLLGFLPVALTLMGFMRRIARRLRGHDPLPQEAGGLLGSLRLVTPLLLLVTAATTMIGGNFRVGVFSLLGALAFLVLWPARGPTGTKPQSLSSGALRDRLFDLANRAGVKLRELYIVPMRRQRLANAFAVNGGVVMVGDELLDRMSRREVDAVLAHEITHLEHHHPLKALLASVVVVVTFSMVATAYSIPFGLPVGIACSWPIFLFLSRRFEFAADAGAAALTSDPEAAVACLGHLSRLNDTPLTWSRSWAWLVTHPTTESRGLAIGRRAGLASQRVADLLANGLPDGERYGHRERPGEEERVYSTAWKTAIQGRLGLGSLAAGVAAPAVTLAVAMAFGETVPPALVILAGTVLAFGAMLLIHDRFAARIVADLEAPLRRRLAEPPGSTTTGPAQEIFVALSPGDRPRIYEGFLDWDLGLLTIDPNALHYRGEQIALKLPRQAVRAIEVGNIAPGWIPAPRVVVRWMGPHGEESLSLRDASPRTVSGIGPSSRDLAAKLAAWHRAVEVPGAHDDPADAPTIGSVTGRTLAEVFSAHDLPVLVAFLAVLASAFSFTFGFDFWLGAQLFAAAFIGVLALRWPAMASREPSGSKAKTSEPERRAA